ncbi:MAG: hypothetical protein J6T45_01205 [Fibrobacterales bacterium]|nr:hypothetical protein [Fibrobacterales bacterium]
MDLRPKISSSRRFAERLVRFRLLLAILLLAGFFWGLDDLVKVSRFWRDDARVALRLLATLLAERHDSVHELVPWAMLSFAGSVGWCAWRFLSAKKTGLFLVLLSLPAWLFSYFGWEPRVHALVAGSLFLAGFAGVLHGLRCWWLAVLAPMVLVLPLFGAVPAYYLGGMGYGTHALTAVPMLGVMLGELFVSFPALGAISAEKPTRMATAVAWLEKLLPAWTGAWLASLFLTVCAAVGLGSSWKSPDLWVAVGASAMVFLALAVVVPTMVSFVPNKAES